MKSARKYCTGSPCNLIVHTFRDRVQKRGRFVHLPKCMKMWCHPTKFGPQQICGDGAQSFAKQPLVLSITSGIMGGFYPPNMVWVSILKEASLFMAQRGRYPCRKNIDTVSRIVTSECSFLTPNGIVKGKFLPTTIWACSSTSSSAKWPF